MEIRKLNAARGWVWVKQGYQLIMRNPLLSISLALAGVLVIFAVSYIPLLGPSVAVLLLPVLLAGYMRICRALEEDEEVELQQLFAGFGKHAIRLVSLGGFMIMGVLIISMVMIFIGGELLTSLLEGFQAGSDPQRLAEVMLAGGASVAFSLLVGFILMFALIMALQYAPMLVFFSGLPPFAALRASLSGSLRNIIPYTVYSLIMQIIALLFSVLPSGVELVVLLPLSLTSLYVSYRNIFPFPGEVPPA